MRMLFTDAPDESLAPLAPFVLRIALGLIFLLHGWQKLSGGLDGVSGFLGELGFPVSLLFAVLLVIAEIGGGILLIAGAFTRITAQVLAFVSAVAWLTVHLRNGFFMADSGYEFIMLIFAGCVALAIIGPGRWSFSAAMRKSSLQ